MTSLFKKDFSLKNPFWEFSISIAKIICLDENENEISFATGFIIQEEKDLYLYTCWHVVSGFDYPNPAIPPNSLSVWPPKRRKIKIICGGTKANNYGFHTSGSKSIICDLYEQDSTGKLKPVWIQGNSCFQNSDLEKVGLFVPLRGDFIKIPIGHHFDADQKELFIKKLNISGGGKITLADEVLIAGYPYGFSVTGNFPEPVFIKRNIASSAPYIGDGVHNFRLLLDGAGYGGMSGSPVFTLKDNKVALFGIYNGVVFPDYNLIEKCSGVNAKNDRHSALGIVTPLASILEDFPCFDIGVCYDEKRSGYFVAGDGFDFFCYFTTDGDDATYIECDCVERHGYGDGFKLSLSICVGDEPPTEEEAKILIDQELGKEEFFFIKSESL